MSRLDGRVMKTNSSYVCENVESNLKFYNFSLILEYKIVLISFWLTTFPKITLTTTENLVEIRRHRSWPAYDLQKWKNSG